MVLTNIKNKQKEGGFTIVELLVVIVVIGILAAITIVSYTGITAKANTTSNLSNAKSVASTLSSLFAEDDAYPPFTTDSSTTIGLINAKSAKMPSSITLVSGNISAATTNIGYNRISATAGVCVSYWDYTASGVRFIGVGNVTVASDSTSCGA